MSDREQYFRKFPITPYRGVPSINLTRRVDFNNNVKKFFTAFYSFNIDSGERIETIAHDYYDDVDFDWLIYHANDIIDPYHGIPLDYDDFNNHIKKKYGSDVRAKQRSIHYESNWSSALSIISVDAYNNLIGARKKYWKPEYNVYTLSGYTRNNEEIYAVTNRIISFSFAADQSTLFTVDEVVRDGSGAVATVASVDSSYITLKHVSGDWEQSSNFTITGDDSGVSIELNHATYKLLQHVIPETEAIYFSAVNYYDYELDLNERKRSIALVDRAYAESINEQLDKLMK